MHNQQTELTAVIYRTSKPNNNMDWYLFLKQNLSARTISIKFCRRDPFDLRGLNWQKNLPSPIRKNLLTSSIKAGTWGFSWLKRVVTY